MVQPAADNAAQLESPVQVVACAEVRPIYFNLLFVVPLHVNNEESILFNELLDKDEQFWNIFCNDVLEVAPDISNISTLANEVQSLNIVWKLVTFCEVPVKDGHVTKAPHPLNIELTLVAPDKLMDGIDCKREHPSNIKLKFWVYSVLLNTVLEIDTRLEHPWNILVAEVTYLKFMPEL